MNFDELFKNTLNWNIKAWGRVYEIFKKLPGQDAAILCEVAKIGIKSNFATLKVAEQLTFIPGDEDAANMEAEHFGEPTRSQLPPIQVPKKQADDKEIAELERIMSLESERVKKLDPNWYNEFLTREHEFDTNLKTAKPSDASQGSIPGVETEGIDKPEVQGEQGQGPDPGSN